MEHAPELSPVQRPRRGSVRAPVALLWALILGYTLFFSAYSLQRHAALNTTATDLSAIDQSMWNTLHGRFLERTVDDRQAPRTAESLEPILLPLSLIYLIWDDVRALLILQTLALALGALPVFRIAAWVLGNKVAARPEGPPAAARTMTVAEWRRQTFGQASAPTWVDQPVAPHGLARWQSEWPALAFAAAYLLFPALQAANLAGFHADSFVVAPLLFAFWYAMRQRYGRMWIWALVALATKETLSTLTVMLGLYVIAAAPGLKAALREEGSLGARLRIAWRGGVGQGSALAAVGLAWYAAATFTIVAPLAYRVYGTAGPSGLAGLSVTFWDALRELARLSYLGKLFAPVGWLALLAPEYVLLGLPLFAANFLSSNPALFSGEQHHSAPLVAALVIAAIFGARRLMALLEDWVPPIPARPGAQPPAESRRGVLAAGLVGAWLLAWAAGQQIQNGWTPLARFFQWPQVTAHDRLLDRFSAEIPDGAAVSATPAVHPHLAHRQKLYLFPTIADAAYVLVDVPGDTRMDPSDVQAALGRLISSGQFGVVDAAGGYMLLQRGAGASALPDAFYDFARAGDRRPHHPLDVRFGESLKLIGYDVVDDPRWRKTRFRFYWQALGPLPAETVVSFQVLMPDGAVVDDSARHPLPALLWYPPARWQLGETVVTESAPWYLPRAWAPAATVAAAGQVWTPQVGSDAGDTRRPVAAADGRLRLPAWGRQGRRLVSYERSFDLPGEASARFGDAGWQVRLIEWAAPLAVAPGSKLAVSLHWQADVPAPRDYSIFVHLRDDSGQTIVTADAPPTWFVPLPSSHWAGGAGGEWTAHALSVPAGLAPGRYELVAGWYDEQTGARLPLIGGAGNQAGDEIVLGPVTVAGGVGPKPDVPCLMAKEACASQE